MTYVGWDGREYEDLELEAMRAGDPVLKTCTRTGVPVGSLEVETCELPAIACAVDDLGDRVAYCVECAWHMLMVTDRPFPILSAFGMSPGEAQELYGS